MVRQQVKKNGEVKAGTDTGNNTDALAAPSLVDPVTETQNELRMTYQTYVKSQKALLSAFKEQEQQGENAYKNMERRYRAYEEIIDKAFKNREMADNEALKLYCHTVEKAGAVYKETIKHTLQLCKQTTDQAWQSSIKASESVKPSISAGMNRVYLSSKSFLAGAAKNIRVKSVGAYHSIERRFREQAKAAPQKT
jgi:HPt (histidine-containing phosphotransfer) domain-containing protein